MSRRVLIPISTGFEEIECFTAVDILRRAGAMVVLAGLGPSPIVGRSQISVLPDLTLDEAAAAGPLRPGGAARRTAQCLHPAGRSPGHCGD